MSHILLVEDNAASRKLLGDILRRDGHEVQLACSADEGIALALSMAFDLIVMDIQLPGTDGLTAIRLLREHECARAIPILAATAHAMRGDEQRMLDAGCDGYIAKPVAWRQFLAEVRRLLEAQEPGLTGR